MCIEEKENLILNNQNLIYFILKKYNSIHNEDLFQIGMIGLIKATEKYDESRNCSFSSFAYQCISNEILVHFRRQNRKSFNDFANTISYNAMINEENGNGTLEEYLGYTPDFDKNIMVKELYNNIDTVLTPIEKSAIVNYYGLGNTIPIKQIELSKTFNMSQANISRIIRRAKRKLKTAMED